MKTTVKENKSTIVGKRLDHSRSESEEVMVFCPSCKALQTVWLNGDTLLPTVKFTQSGNHIYHNCGSALPCRLFFDR
jgi:hypothetical protein